MSVIKIAYVKELVNILILVMLFRPSKMLISRPISPKLN